MAEDDDKAERDSARRLVGKALEKLPRDVRDAVEAEHAEWDLSQEQARTSRFKAVILQTLDRIDRLAHNLTKP